MVASALAWARAHLAQAFVIGGCGLALVAGAAGYATAQALGVLNVTPAKTVTINVATGPTGPAGPPGPAGPKGEAGSSASCPQGYEAGRLVINAPGGQVALWTCLAD